MKITKSQLRLIIENFLYEQDAPPEEEGADEIDQDDEGSPPEDEAENEDVPEDEPEEDPVEDEEIEETFEEFDTKDNPIDIGNKSVFVKVIDKGINSVKVYYLDSENRVENLTPMEISSLMFKTLVQIIQNGGDEEDRQNVINFFKYSIPDLENKSNVEIEKYISLKERLWKMNLIQLENKLNRENYIK